VSANDRDRPAWLVGPGGSTAWLIQRLSGFLLVVLLGTHLLLLHYGGEGQLVFAAVTVRLKAFLFILIDSGLLALGLYHGLNGLRNVVLDWNISRRAASILTGVLWTVGIMMTIYGATALVSFWSGRGVFGG
jgi:succinate dehydrogenase hydrophobic anchor subunit